MKTFDLIQAAKAVGGTVKGENVEVSGVFTDSRNPVPGGLFTALTGERFDGHEFVRSLEEGETAAVMIGKQLETSLPAVIVKDTGKALCDLAAWHRARFDIPVIALTGSVGKTTTKEMIAVVLSRIFNTLKTEGNLNNNIGMPLTLLRLDDDIQAAVIEMGMNHAGELSLLTSICRPTAALITNVGVNHIENLGSRENILKAKLEILEGLEKGSRVFLNADNDLLGALDLPDFEVIRYGLESDAEFTARDVKTDPLGSSFVLCAHGEKSPVRLNSPGIHNVSNALAAAAEKTSSWRFDGCCPYVTLEPCVMCAGALVQCRVERIVFGAKDPKGGGCRSLYEIPQDPRLSHRCSVTGGVLARECAEILRNFFEAKRKGTD